ncbi:GNAT family N-acetyltransferase [Fulvimarina pelagi]|nr:GNAT family protein [Fulvimarina pelagi]
MSILGPVYIETRRYVLRSMRSSDDLNNLGAWASDPSFAAALNIAPHVYDADALVRYVLAHDNRSRYLLGAFDQSGRHIGCIIFQINQIHRNAVWHIIFGDREERRMTVVAELVVAAMDWLFDTRGIDKVTSRTAAANMVINERQRSLGVRQEGYLKAELLSADGQTRLDQVLWGLTKSDWKGSVRTRLSHLSAPAGSTHGNA